MSLTLDAPPQAPGHSPHLTSPTPAPDVGSVVLLGVLVALGVAVLFWLEPVVGAFFAILGIGCLWRCAKSHATAPTSDAPRVCRLAFFSTLVGTISLGIWSSTAMLLPTAGLIGVGLGVWALRRIRAREGRLEGKAFAYVGLVLGFLNLFLFAFGAGAAGEVGYQTVG